MSFAVLGLVAVGFLTFTDNHNKIIKSIDAGFEVVDFVGQTRLVLSQPRACLQTLAGLPVTSATNRSITTIRGTSVVPYSSNPVLFNDYIYKTVNSPISLSQNVTLSAVEIKYPPTFNGEVELILKLKRKSQASVGGADLIRTIPLTIIADPAIPSKIGTCFASGAKVANWASMCATLGGEYDPVTKKCKGLFKINFSSQVTPANDHYEKLEYNMITGEVRIVIL